MNKNPYLLTLPQLMTAKQKIGKVACFYDPLKTSLSAFHAETLEPTEFREQLRRTFFITLSDEELGAIVTMFDNGEKKVDCMQFINEFFRLGKQQKFKLKMQKKELDDKIERFHEKLRETREKRLEAFNKTKVAETWTEEEEISAVRKITKVAFSYDFFKGGLEGFYDVIEVTPIQFRELMRRNFDCYLSAEEAAALVHAFDSNGNGSIDAKEFMYHFFRLGRNEKDRHFRKSKKITAKRAEETRRRKAAIKDKFGKLVLAKICPASEQDKKTALSKITNAAIRYRSDCQFMDIRKSFEADSLSPTEFRELLKQNFDIFLSPGELDAVITIFDADGDGTISCIEFMTTFFRTGMKENKRRLEAKRAETARILREEEERKRKKIENYLALTQTKISYPILPEDDTDDIWAQDSHASSTKSNNNSQILSPIDPSRASTAPGESSSKRRMSRKPSMADLAESQKLIELIMKNKDSLVKKFPKASKETKDFLLQLEEEEKKLDKLKFRKKTKSSNFEVGTSLDSMKWGYNDSIEKVDSPFTKRSNASFRNVLSKGSSNSDRSGGGSGGIRSGKSNQDSNDGYIDQFPILEEDEEIEED